MADFFGAASDLFGGIGSVLGGNAAAAGSKQAAVFYDRAAALTKLETGLKETAANRQIFQTLGGARADVAANGLLQSGSAEDVLRSSAQQGALSKALIQLQGDIGAESYTAQAAQARATASSQHSGGLLGGLMGLAGAAASIFSDDRLKRDAKLLGRRESDGLGLWLFRYIGNDEWYEGVMASEVEQVYPDAVTWSQGFRKVDYKMIGFTLNRVGGDRYLA